MEQIALLESTGYFAVCNEDNPIRSLEYCEGNIEKNRKSSCRKDRYFLET